MDTLAEESPLLKIFLLPLSLVGLLWKKRISSLGGVLWTGIQKGSQLHSHSPVCGRQIFLVFLVFVRLCKGWFQHPFFLFLSKMFITLHNTNALFKQLLSIKFWLTRAQNRFCHLAVHLIREQSLGVTRSFNPQFTFGRAGFWDKTFLKLILFKVFHCRNLS